MSEIPINHGTSEDRVHVPVWRTLINLVIAVLAATLAPFFLVCLLILPLGLGLVAFSYGAPPGILKDLTEAAGGISWITAYFGIGSTLCMGVEFVILGIPTAILGWRLGRITWRSSIIAGFLIGCLPWLLILPFDQSFGSIYLSLSNKIFQAVTPIVVLGALGAFEGFLFWLVWRFLSHRSVPTKHGVS